MADRRRPSFNAKGMKAAAIFLFSDLLIGYQREFPVNVKTILIIGGILVVVWIAAVVVIVGDLPAINPAFWFN